MEASTEEPVAPPGEKPPVDEWRRDRNGKEWVPRKDGRPGRISRQGDESIEQARARDSGPAEERRPRRKPKKPPPAAAAKSDLRELEGTLAEALKSPAMVAAMFGDEWAATHFTNSGPFLARNICNAAESNPWLRRKLEDALAGEEAMMKAVGVLGVGGGLVMYFVPPIVYYLNLAVPPKAREMLGVPPRREPIYAPPPPPPPDPSFDASAA